jgi:hypothetical protein
MKNTNTQTKDRVFTTKQIIYFLLGACTFLTALSYLLIKANA